VTVLLVDDDFAVLDAMGELLRDEGYIVGMAQSGRDALAQLREAESLPSLILLDLMMPDMNGWEFREHQARDPRLAGIPTVIVSANIPEQLSQELGVGGFVRKPLDAAELLAVVRLHCRPS